MSSITVADKLKNQLAQKQEAELAAITKDAKAKGISLTITTQGDYQFVAMDGDEMHTEESFEELTKKEQEYFGSTIDELEIKLRDMVRQLTEWEEAYSEKIKKLNDDVTLDVITHFIKQLKKDYSGYPTIKTYLTELQQDIVDNADIFLEQSGEQAEVATASLDKNFPDVTKLTFL